VYPARAWPHKNHERLFAAFAELRRRDPDLELVLTAYDGPTPPGVRSLGHVPRAELVRLYRSAAGLVFPSLYEGFGLPPIEAMACGCPVAASSAGSLPEVLGDAAVPFAPDDPASIAAGILESLERSDELSAAGLERARLFTWDATARAHDRVYELAAGS
jgi:glycosyltransferase involved in cell wall biosynthesis